MAKSKPKIAADLAREIWRMKGKCENCQKTKADGWQLHGAHILGVGAHIRVCSDLRNGFSLCASCHRYFEDNPFDFVEFVNGSWAEKYMTTLRRLARPGGPKISWDDRIDFLKEIRRAIKAGELTIEEAREYECD